MRSRSYFNIGIDFDDIVWPWYDYAHQAVVRAGHGTLEDKPTMWAAHDHYGLSLDEWVAVIDNEIDNGKMYQTLISPMFTSQVNEMYDLGHEIYIVTARGQFGTRGDRIRELTYDCIDRSAMRYSEIAFTKDKPAAYKNLDLDFMVDDSEKNHQALVEAGCNSFLMDQPWNQEYVEEWFPEGRRIANLETYFDMIKTLADK